MPPSKAAPVCYTAETSFVQSVVPLYRGSQSRFVTIPSEESAVCCTLAAELVELLAGSSQAEVPAQMLDSEFTLTAVDSSPPQVNPNLTEC